MATTALIAVGILTLLVFVLFNVLLELFRDVRQIRDALGILDRPLTVDIKSVGGTAPSRYGLPRQLDDDESSLLLFLSDKCATCRVLAASLGGTLPAGLWIVVEAATRQAATEFVETYGMTPRLQDRVILDPSGAIAGQLDLNMTPVAYRIERGIFKDATTVPSLRYLASITPIPSEGPIDTQRSGNLPALRFVPHKSFKVMDWLRQLGRKQRSHDFLGGSEATARSG